MQRNKIDVRTDVVARIFFDKLILDGIHFCLGLPWRYSGFQAADDFEVVPGPEAEQVIPRPNFEVAARQPCATQSTAA